MFDEDKTLYMVMEYVPNGTLQDMLRKGPINEVEARKIFKQIIKALLVISYFTFLTIPNDFKVFGGKQNNTQRPETRKSTTYRNASSKIGRLWTSKA